VDHFSREDPIKCHFQTYCCIHCLTIHYSILLIFHIIYSFYISQIVDNSRFMIKLRDLELLIHFLDLRFSVVKIPIAVPWVTIPCSLVGSHQHCRGMYCLLKTEAVCFFTVMANTNQTTWCRNPDTCDISFLLVLT
jgi:hypothetical protein